MVARGGVCLAHLCVMVVVLVRFQLGLTVRGESVYSETSFSPCCRHVSKLVVMARGVLQRRGVEDSRLWLLRGGAVTFLSTKCLLPGVSSSSSVDQSTVRHIPVPHSPVTTYSEDDMGIPGI
ncbi:unnamed protein product [Brassica oleracea var. botrytis]